MVFASLFSKPVKSFIVTLATEVGAVIRLSLVLLLSKLWGGIPNPPDDWRGREGGRTKGGREGGREEGERAGGRGECVGLELFR